MLAGHGGAADVLEGVHGEHLGSSGLSERTNMYGVGTSTGNIIYNSVLQASVLDRLRAELTAKPDLQIDPNP